MVRDLHWLSVQHRITYKLCLLMHLVHNNRSPSYLVDSVTATASLSHCGRLRSASSQRYEQWLKWFCEVVGGSPDEARLEQTPYPFQPH